MLPNEIHTERVLHLLFNLKTSKATGPDKIPIAIFYVKELAYQYSAFINQGSVPSDWRMANVPIFKKGSNPTLQIQTCFFNKYML